MIEIELEPSRWTGGAEPVIEICMDAEANDWEIYYLKMFRRETSDGVEYCARGYMGFCNWGIIGSADACSAWSDSIVTSLHDLRTAIGCIHGIPY